MEYVLSKDGTPIAYTQCGKGPPLLLIHGTGIDHTYWMTVTAKQETYFAVYAVLSGQGHEAVLPAPELFLCEVLGFFERI